MRTERKKGKSSSEAATKDSKEDMRFKAGSRSVDEEAFKQEGVTNLSLRFVASSGASYREDKVQRNTVGPLYLNKFSSEGKFIISVCL